jgi:hypothetical protein
MGSGMCCPPAQKPPEILSSASSLSSAPSVSLLLTGTSAEAGFSSAAVSSTPPLGAVIVNSLSLLAASACPRNRWGNSLGRPFLSDECAQFPVVRKDNHELPRPALTSSIENPLRATGYLAGFFASVGAALASNSVAKQQTAIAMPSPVCATVPEVAELRRGNRLVGATTPTAGASPPTHRGPPPTQVRAVFQNCGGASLSIAFRDANQGAPR